MQFEASPVTNQFTKWSLFGYLKGQSIDDNFTYPNLKYINDSLKQYRSGAYDQYIQESQQANDQNGSDE